MYIPAEVSFDDLSNAIKGISGKKKIGFRVSLLDGAEEFIMDLSDYFLDGSVDVDADRDVTRGATLSMVNNEGLLTLVPIIPSNPIWYNSRFFIEYGIYVPEYGDYCWIPEGVYLLDSPEYDSKGGMTLNLIGKSSLLSYKNGETIYLESGLSIEEAVRRIVCKIDNQESCSTAHVKNASFTWTEATPGNWEVMSYASAYNGHVVRNNTTDDYVEWTATGRQFTWAATKATNRGIANVYIDGVLDAEVDLYVDPNVYRQHVYTKKFPYGGQHTIKIEVSGTKNDDSSDYFIDIDALQMSRIFTDDELLFEQSGKTITKSITYADDQVRWQCAKELASSFSLVMFEDGFGKIRLQLYPKFASQGIDWYYEKGEEAILLDVSKTNKGPQFNHVVVSYGDSDTAPSYQERKAETDDTSTPFPTTGSYGDRVDLIRDSNVKTALEARTLARKMLEEYMATSEEISVQSATNPIHDPYDKIVIVEGDYTKISGYYQLRQFDIPFGLGKSQSLSVSSRRLINIE